MLRRKVRFSGSSVRESFFGKLLIKFVEYCVCGFKKLEVSSEKLESLGEISSVRGLLDSLVVVVVVESFVRIVGNWRIMCAGDDGNW